MCSDCDTHPEFCEFDHCTACAGYHCAWEDCYGCEDREHS